MTTTTHTPGPWTTGGELILSGNVEIASVWYRWARRPFSPPNDEADANRRLIVAAPDLLALVEEIAAPWAAAVSIGFDSGSHECAFCEKAITSGEDEDGNVAFDPAVEEGHKADCLVLRARAQLAAVKEGPSR